MSENQPVFFTETNDGESVKNLQLGLVASRFNENLVISLIQDGLNFFENAGVGRRQIQVLYVPGAYELPFAVNRLCDKGDFDAILTLGVVIGGETQHHQIIAHSVSHAFQKIVLERHTPVINGVIVTANRTQAIARSSGEKARGTSLAQTALAMAILKNKLRI